MKRIVVIMMVLLASLKGWGQTKKVSELPVRNTRDTGTYVVVVENTGGTFGDYLLKADSLGAVLAVTSTDTSLQITTVNGVVNVALNMGKGNRWAVVQRYGYNVDGQLDSFAFVPKWYSDSSMASAISTALAGNAYVLPSFTGSGGMQSSSITDSTGVHSLHIADSVHLDAVGTAINADNLLVLGTNRHTVRYAPYPTGDGNIIVTWPGDTFRMKNKMTAGTYGCSSCYVIATVDTTGMITGITTGTMTAMGVTSVSASFSSPNSTLTGTATVTNATTTPAIAITAQLPAVNSTPGTVGSSTVTNTITTDAYGRVLSVTPTAISIPVSQINNFSSNALMPGGNSLGAALSFGTNDLNSLKERVDGILTDSTTAYLRERSFYAKDTSTVSSSYAEYGFSFYDTLTSSTPNAYLMRLVDVGNNGNFLNCVSSSGASSLSISNGGNVACGLINSSNITATAETINGFLSVNNTGGGGNSISKSNTLNQSAALTVNNTVTTNQWGLLKLDSGSVVIDSFGAHSTYLSTNVQSSGTYSNNYFLAPTSFGSTTNDGSNAVGVFGNIKLENAGNKINLATGSNSITGTGTLSSGTVTVSNTSVTASSIIWVQYNGAPSGSTGNLTVTAKSAGASFTVTSYTTGSTPVTNTSDNNAFQYWIIN